MASIDPETAPRDRGCGMKTNNKAAEMAEVKRLMASVRSTVQNIAMQMHFLDDDLREHDGSRTADVARSVQTASYTMAAQLSADCQALASSVHGLVKDSINPWSELSILADDVLSGSVVMARVLRAPGDPAFRESIDFCQLGLTAMLSELASLHRAAARDLAGHQRNAKRRAA